MVNLALGDQVQIQGRTHIVVANENENGTPGNSEFTLVDVTCRACGENDAYDSEPGGMFLCPGCLNDAWEYTVLQGTVERMPSHNTPLERALDILHTVDARERNKGYQYIDTNSAAWDSMSGVSTDEMDRWIARWGSRIVADVIAHRGM